MAAEWLHLGSDSGTGDANVPEDLEEAVEVEKTWIVQHLAPLREQREKASSCSLLRPSRCESMRSAPNLRWGSPDLASGVQQYPQSLREEGMRGLPVQDVQTSLAVPQLGRSVQSVMEVVRAERARRLAEEEHLAALAKAAAESALRKAEPQPPASPAAEPEVDSPRFPPLPKSPRKPSLLDHLLTQQVLNESSLRSPANSSPGRTRRPSDPCGLEVVRECPSQECPELPRVADLDAKVKLDTLLANRRAQRPSSPCAVSAYLLKDRLSLGCRISRSVTGGYKGQAEPAQVRHCIWCRSPLPCAAVGRDGLVFCPNCRHSFDPPAAGTAGNDPHVSYIELRLEGRTAGEGGGLAGAGNPANSGASRSEAQFAQQEWPEAGWHQPPQDSGDWQPQFGFTPAPPAAPPPAPVPRMPPGVGGEPVPPQRFTPGTRKRKLCIHHESGNCRYGSDCNFAHGLEDLAEDCQEAVTKRPQTERMDFTGLEAGRLTKSLTVPQDQVSSVMTPSTRELLLEVTGAYDIEWVKQKRSIQVTGTAAQLEKAEKALQRVVAHCNWGATEAKIRSILRPRLDYKSARIRLASMAPTLKDFTKTLTSDKATFSIGTDPTSALRVKGPLVSRSHAVVEFQPDKGSVYVVDTSTNGTFLNGKRLPPKASAKVMLSHGDELLLQDPSQGAEFGYMVNVELPPAEPRDGPLAVARRHPARVASGVGNMMDAAFTVDTDEQLVAEYHEQPSLEALAEWQMQVDPMQMPWAVPSMYGLDAERWRGGYGQGLKGRHAKNKGLMQKQRFCATYPTVSRCRHGTSCAFAHSRDEVTAPLLTPEEEAAQPEALTVEFFTEKFKTMWCPVGAQHDWQACMYAHTYQDVRRPPSLGYGHQLCPYWNKKETSLAYSQRCPLGPRCPFAHGAKEQLYHPNYFRTLVCRDLQRRRCPRGVLCAFFHRQADCRKVKHDPVNYTIPLPEKAIPTEWLVHFLSPPKFQEAGAAGSMQRSAYASFGCNGQPRERTGLRSGSSWYSPEELSSFDPSAKVAVANGGSSSSSFYGKGLAAFRHERPEREREFREPRERRDLQEELSAGKNVFVMPKRPPRRNECYALDKDLAAAGVGCLDVAMRHAEAMDAPNWANLFYALAHCKKRGNLGALASCLRTDPRWSKSCQLLGAQLADLTARDAANVVWSLATLEARQEPLLLEAADALCGKLAVCDPVSISKATWALTGVSNRDRRLDLFAKLAVPVILRADSFPLGSLTMIAYSFAKADFRDGDAYEALSSALTSRMDSELRPIDVCNVIWSFCTVGYRDDVLFEKLCEMYLTKEVVRNFNPQDLTNTAWGFCKVAFVHKPAMEALARACHAQRFAFDPIHFSNLLYAFATLRMQGPAGVLEDMCEAAAERIQRFDGGNLAIAAWAVATLQLQSGRLLDLALARACSPEVCSSLGSRALSMVALACFRTQRLERLDDLLRATRAAGLGFGASGYSAAVMAAEQGADADRELRTLQAMAEEAKDGRMRAAVANSLAVRLWQRGFARQAFAVLQELRASSHWTVVSSLLAARLGEECGLLQEASELLASNDEFAEWQAPVTSGIHPMAATRQNEGAHAYTREFMTLHAVLCGAPPGDPDACMAAVERRACHIGVPFVWLGPPVVPFYPFSLRK
ncbi:unnamed protein product [Effrenium voratum]|nr:unnamed protein product [Effrenium voratum]